MTRSAFDPDLDDLPREIPIFPLAGALLLPGGQLPLNIFEPRYLAMVRYAMATPQRIIGMIQPGEQARRSAAGTQGDMGAAPVYRTGCAGRIIKFAESADGRYFITLKGIARFDVDDEVEAINGFRRVSADFAPYADDLHEPEEPEIDRARLIRALQSYFGRQGIDCDWEEVRNSANARLITSLAMVCPFDPGEKQALLEATGQQRRAEMLTQLLELATLEGGDGNYAPH